ncbi:MAG: SDR family oxidoreductase [Actinobacteria bacterium]|nr:SDR family oxidoreductase [Actinomycetota bacterium]
MYSRLKGKQRRSKILSSLHTSEEFLKIEKKIPIRRLGTENDVANVVAFHASDLSSYIFGETILADGGVTFGG